MSVTPSKQNFTRPLVFQLKAEDVITADKTLRAQDMGGVLIVSGAAAITVALPNAADCRGATVIFRQTDDNQHVISGSSPDALLSAVGDVGDTTGGQVEFAAVEAQAIRLTSDGVVFHCEDLIGSSSIS